MSLDPAQERQLHNVGCLLETAIDILIADSTFCDGLPLTRESLEETLEIFDVEAKEFQTANMRARAGA